MADTSTVWNTPANVEKIKGFKGNVVAMGDAAYWLYGKMGLQIGYPHGVSGLSGGTGRVDNPITPALRTPYPVAIDSGLTDSLYSTNPSQSAFYTGGGIPFAAKSLVRHGSMFSYSVVITESRGGLCYQMWGYNEPPSGMTTEGKLLFRNLVVAPACNWPVYLPSISR